MSDALFSGIALGEWVIPPNTPENHDLLPVWVSLNDGTSFQAWLSRKSIKDNRHAFAARADWLTAEMRQEFFKQYKETVFEWMIMWVDKDKATYAVIDINTYGKA